MDIEGAELPILTKLCETGAIKKIKRLVCEFHVWQDKMDEFVKILGLLRSNKMQFSTNAAAGPILDWQPRNSLLKSLSESRFSSIYLHGILPKRTHLVEVLVGQGNERSCKLLIPSRSTVK
jgi:hypothetical protein